MDREAQTMRGLYPNAQVGTCNWMTTFIWMCRLKGRAVKSAQARLGAAFTEAGSARACAITFRAARIARFAHQSFARRSRSALVTTDTELIAMAAPAKIGDSTNPKKG